MSSAMFATIDMAKTKKGTFAMSSTVNHTRKTKLVQKAHGRMLSSGGDVRARQLYQTTFARNAMASAMAAGQ